MSEVGRALAAMDRGAGRWGIWVVLLLAAIYYPAYALYGLNLGGEGGTTAVIAMRLNEGQRPIADTFLGYNVLWFYPVAWLFRVTGPDYLAMKGFFFALCAVSGALGFLTVRKVTGSGLLAVAAGVVLVLIPGMLFRNYMGLLGVANQLAMVSAFAMPPTRPVWRAILIGVSGLVLGVTFLIRIEVGWLMTVIWAGLVALALLAPGGIRSWKPLAAGVALAVAAFIGVHAPFARDAFRRGYADSFFHQYRAFLGLFRWELQKQFAPPPPPPTAAPAVSSGGGNAAAPPTVQDGRRQRPAPAEIFSGRRGRDRFFAAAIYLPVVLAAGMAACALVVMGCTWWRGDGALWERGLAVLVLDGCALTLFPQYFFFRPDTPHITEFMVPFFVALACAAGLAVRSAFERPSRKRVALAVAAGLVLATQTFVHFGHAWRKESAGTIAARKGGAVEFRGLNNVRAMVPPERAEGLRLLLETILANSSPADWVVCLPYSPTINLLTDRPSYLWNLYVDNTLAGPRFDAERIAELRKYNPAAIVIDHRPINASEASRFRNWAPGFYRFVLENYDFAGEFAGNEVFVRREDGPR